MPRRGSSSFASPSTPQCRPFRAASSHERYYSGDPVRLAGTLYGLYDKDTHIDRVVAMLDEIEAHHPPPVAGEG